MTQREAMEYAAKNSFLDLYEKGKEDKSTEVKEALAQMVMLEVIDMWAYEQILVQIGEANEENKNSNI